MEAWLDWARGPMFRFALAFLILGLARQVGLTAWGIWRTLHRAGDKSIPLKAVAKSTWAWLFPYKKIKNQMVYSAATVSFHVAAILVPILLAGHVALVQRGIGLSWPTIPNLLADLLTIAAVAAAAAVIVKRVATPDTRALSRFSDYALPVLVALPFASGFLVMHGSINPFPFEATFLVHVLSANLLMILIPITKLSHVVLLPGTQLISEAAWHWPPDGGAKVALALGKENEPI